MTAPHLPPTPEEIAYVEARCSEIRAILHRPPAVVAHPATELTELQRLLGLSAKERPNVDQ
jgi:hypothetical protein